MKYLKAISLFVILFSIDGSGQEIEKMLTKSIEKLNSLKSISYKSISSSSAPYDSVLVNQYAGYHKVIIDPSDSIIGARSLFFQDSTKLLTSYYKNIAANYNWANKTIRVDTLSKELSSLMSPFYVEVRELLKYVVSNKDSILCQINEFKDSIEFSFLIKNKLAYFISMVPFVSISPNSYSKYILWTDKELMPFRLKRIMPHQTSSEEIITMSNCDPSEIIEKQIGIFIPEGFTIKDKNGSDITSTCLEGKEAPAWMLNNLDGKSISLSDFKGRNLLVEFTGLGCGYCHLAIPFLNKFTNEYKEKGFDVISLETFSNNIEGLKRYKNQNKMIYEFVIADKGTTVNYKVLGVPVFILVNKNGIIEKAFVGYAKDETDKLVKAVADKM